MRQRTYGAGDFSHAHVLGGVLKPLDVAPGLRVPVGQFEPKSRRLSMNSMRPANGWSVLKFKCPALEDRLERLKVVANDQRSIANLQRLRRIDHVIRGQTEMQPARFSADFFPNRGGERDYVMLHLGFNRLDPRQVEVGALPNSFSGRVGYQTSLGQALGGRNFHLQPCAKAIVLAPNAPHFGSRVPGNQVFMPPKYGRRAFLGCANDKKA